METANIPDKCIPRFIEELLVKSCDVLNVTVKDIYSHKRNKEYVRARQIIWFVLREMYNFSYLQLSRHFRFHHATIIHAVSSAKPLCVISSEYCADLDSVYNIAQTIATKIYYNMELEKTTPIEFVLNKYCINIGTTPQILSSNKRDRRTNDYKFAFVYAVRRLYAYTYTSIGKCLNKDHTTILHAYNKACDLIGTDKKFAKLIKLALEYCDLENIKPTKFNADFKLHWLSKINNFTL